MADNPSYDPDYGQLGKATYDAERKSWEFERQTGTTFMLKPLGPCKTAVDNITTTRSSRPIAHEGLTTRPPSVQYQGRTKDLIHGLPELVPAVGHLPPFERTSDAIDSVVSQHDPAKGDLLSFGTAYDEASHGTFQRTLAAVPSGIAGENLRLVYVGHEDQGWEKNKSIWLDVPHFSRESGWWAGDGAPIQQVCFAQLADGAVALNSTLLAVRFQTATCIFNPIFRRTATVTSHPLRKPPSRIDPNMCFTLPVTSTGNAPHADVSFSPWYQKQFGIVDQEGTWSVWHLERNRESKGQTRRGRGYRISEVCRAAVSEQVDGHKIKEQVVDDGWARIVWAGDVHTVAVCSRRELAVYDICSKPVRLQSPNLGIKGTAHWILDVRKSPVNQNQFLILTSTHVSWLSISRPGDSGRDGCDTHGAKVVLSWRHYRDTEDISIRMCLSPVEEDVLLLLRSSFNTLITAYRSHSSKDDEHHILSITDAIHVPVPSELLEPPHSSSPRIMSMTLKRLLYVIVDEGKTGYFRSLTAEGRQQGVGGPGELYRKRDVAFFIWTAICDNLQVYDSLYYAIVFSAKQPSVSSSAIVAPRWHRSNPESATRVQSEGFVVNDGFEESDEGSLRVPPRSSGKRSRQLPKSDVDQWTVSYRLAYKRTQNSADEEREDMQDVTLRVQRLLEDEENDATQIGDALMQDLLDFDMQRDRLERSRHRLTPVAPLSLLDIQDSSIERISLSSIYKTIVGHWLAPLSPKVPGRTRLAMEQQARNIAAELALASLRLRVEDPAHVDKHNRPSTVNLEEPASQSLSFNLPDRSSQPTTPSQPKRESQRSGVQTSGYNLPTPQRLHAVTALPTPSPTATPSVASQSLSHANSSTRLPAYDRLNCYTNFAVGRRAPRTLPKSLNNLLSHWTIGEDPDQYDWLETQRNIDREADAEDEQLTERDKARIRRRAQRHLERQRRETAAAASQAQASSQAGLVAFSQPTAIPSRIDRDAPALTQPMGAVGPVASQMTDGQVLAASQIEPGRFGGRAPVRKKRKIGF
ncbi:hypothetical protein LTR66_007691 [Elasticomyces elasticus]|nr:hypothetical protein LTR66_007691 [Elasticomyces elasticus]